MYYIDTNILIYVNSVDSPFHRSASEIFYNILNREKAIISEIVLAEFFSVITDSRKMEHPWTTSQAAVYIRVLLDSVQELHFLNKEIISGAFEAVESYNIRRYSIFDHLIAYSMRFYGVDKIVTLNKNDFRKYDFIEEIITPVRD